MSAYEKAISWRTTSVKRSSSDHSKRGLIWPPIATVSFDLTAAGNEALPISFLRVPIICVKRSANFRILGPLDRAANNGRYLFGDGFSATVEYV